MSDKENAMESTGSNTDIIALVVIPNTLFPAIPPNAIAPGAVADNNTGNNTIK